MKMLQKYWKHPLLKGICFTVCFICVERFCHKITEGFRPHKILSKLPFNPDYATPPLAAEEIAVIKNLLSQPFYFLGSGGQCYAFESKNGETIIKVFKHHHMRPDSFLSRIPLPGPLDPLRKKIIRLRKERLQEIFSSFKLAHDRFKDHTGMLFLHLNKTDVFHQKITLVDNIGVAHIFDLDDLEFALQKKAVLAYPKLHACMQAKDIAAAKRCLKSLVILMVERSKSGLADRDPIVKRNFGFIGEKAIEIDLGSFYADPLLTKPAAYKKQLFCESLKLKHWVHKRYPELYPYLEKIIRKTIEKDL